MQQPGAATTSLSGLRVVELAGLAPSQALGMLLADHGADVLVVLEVSGKAEAKTQEHLAEAAHCGDHLDVRSQPAARQRGSHGGQYPRRHHVRARLAVRT